MADTGKLPQKTTVRRRRASRSVYFFDKTANVVIRVGGIFVVIAVLGLVAFIFSQAVPLFGSSDQGAMDVPVATMPGRTLYIGYDEYRRVGVRISEGSEVEIFSVLSGETLRKVPVPGLGKAKLTAASVTLRHYALGLYQGVPNVPRYALLVGTNDGRVLAGQLLYVTDYQRFALGTEPPALKELKLPAESDFKSPAYQPPIAVVEAKGSKWVAEHMPEFGFYRYMRADVVFDRAVELPSNGEAIEALHLSVEHGEPEAELETLTGAITAKGRALLKLQKLAVNPMTEEVDPQDIATADLTGLIEGRARFVQVHESRKEALFATTDGVLHVLRRGLNPLKPDDWGPSYPGLSVLGEDDENRRPWRETAAAMRDDGAAPEGRLELTAMSYLLGDTTLLLGDSYGGVQSWFQVRATDEDQNPRYRRIRAHASGSGAIRGFSSAQATKAFVVWDDSGRVRTIHNTSERVYFDANIEGGAPTAGYFASKGDGLVCVDAQGRVQQWWLHPGHSEVSFKTLFGKVFYEGYREPEYLWQSHAGTDDVETKYSLMPLITGSIKGGIYALLFALPLAVLGAVYTSEFMAPRLRSVIKPSMEVMASLPSVVLGFLGALYFAPTAAPIMPTLVVFALLAPTVFMLYGWIFGQLPPYVTKRFTPLVTSLALCALLLGAAWLSAFLGPRLESRIFPAVEGANPAILDAFDFNPLTEEDVRATSAGNFRTWTDGGRELPRPLVVAQGKPPTAVFADGTEKEIPLGSQLTIAADTTARRWAESASVPIERGASIVVHAGVFAWKESLVDTTPVVLAPDATFEIGGKPAKVSGGDFRHYPKSWWVPGGHALFALLLVLPCALLAGGGLKLGYALLFGGRVLGRDIAGRLGGPGPLRVLRDKLAGTSAGLRPVSADVGFALINAAVAFGLGWLIASVISGPIEALLFSYDHPTAGTVADFRRWVTGPTGWKFDQTNSLIVGFAMGFAVIPIIYSIAEDALSSVPNQMRAASLACGASRWQTAMRVVVPAAASGIFSAIVIGLGRALGETMIVVMAAGGTPLMDLQPLSGFRSLSAAIAIEMPEAPHGSTHYRTLFLGGLLLFLMTFVISTLAEFVRMRLRRKLSRM